MLFNNLHKNFNRLLIKCEELAEKNDRSDWHLEKVKIH
jgi:hypothetical protein